jgi:hypothetical protein
VQDDSTRKLLLLNQTAPIDYWSVLHDGYHDYRLSYDKPVTNLNIWSHIQLNADLNLIQYQPKQKTVMLVFPWLGGWFCFLVVFGQFFAGFVTPFMTYLSITLRLFRTDPNKGQTPRDPLQVEKATA